MTKNGMNEANPPRRTRRNQQFGDESRGASAANGTLKVKLAASMLLLLSGLLTPPSLHAIILTNGSLTVDIRSGNGAIDSVTFGGANFYDQGTHVSDWGLQSGTDTSSFRLNNTYGGTDQPVSVTSSPGTVTVSGTFTAGGNNLAFSRSYTLVAGFNVLRITTEFVNNGGDMTVSYFDTFDPDQGYPLGFGFGTFNDVFTLGSAKVGQAYASNDLTVVMGSQDPAVTVAAGFPFSIWDGATLNSFFSAPFDGNGAFDDSGLHIGFRFILPAGGSRTVIYDQAYGTTHSAAQTAFTGAQLCGNGVLDPGEGCDNGLANGSPSSCCTTICSFRSAGETCRAAAGVCDLPDSCTGSSGTCPVDAKSSSACRPSAGDCDLAESCDGVADTCPADAKQPSTHVCRLAAGTCDLDDTCDGSTDDCPADAKSSAECRASNGVCDPAESCDGVNDDCPADAKSSAECRASNGVCDPTESCDGVNDDCPADAKSSAECRASNGVCDPAESCDGVNDDCPSDAKSTALCRASGGVCDVDDYCNGIDDNCPLDVKQPASHICRAAVDVCDATELCDGSTNACPADSKQPSGTVCRALADECDIVETCNGSSNTCPANAVMADDTPCFGPNNNTCLNTCQSGFCSPDFISQCCGNGTLEAAELCDDGNQANADGCSDHCGLDLDAFQCYRNVRAFQPAPPAPLTLIDAVNSSMMPSLQAGVDGLHDSCNPASLNGQHPGAPGQPDHLQSYRVSVVQRRSLMTLLPERDVKVVNQFGTLYLDLTWPRNVLLPTGKSLVTTPPAPVSPAVDHFTCYKVKRAKGRPRFQRITGQIMTDLFGTRSVTLVRPSRLCLPANQNNQEPGAESNIGHLLCYRVRNRQFDVPGTAYIHNELGAGSLQPKALTELCVPSVKNPS
jgi:cysteine-rich repeat protein